MNKHPKAVAEFVDKYGDKQVIHRNQGRSNVLRVYRGRTTDILKANPVIAGLVGERIRARREAKGWTLAECAMRAGIVSGHPKNRMWEIERGTRGDGVRLGTLAVLAKALGCEPGDLLPTLAEIEALSPLKLDGSATDVPAKWAAGGVKLTGTNDA